MEVSNQLAFITLLSNSLLDGLSFSCNSLHFYRESFMLKILDGFEMC